MALIVAMKEGDQVQVGEKLYTMLQVQSPEECVVVDVKTSVVYFIGIKEWVEIAPKVKLMVGISDREHGSWVKLLIKAPSEILISEIKKGG